MLENELLTEDEKSYTNFLRMNQTVFNKLFEKVGLLSWIAKQITVMRQSISAKKRLLLTLRYLATGESRVSLSYSTRIAKNTIGGIVMETVNAIISCLIKDYLKIPDTQEKWVKIAADLYDMWQFPNCLGAMDGKHITFRPRRADGAFYHNYEGTDSFVLLGVCDAKYFYIVG
ncbi:unnamed protein product [Macrosiphum euphorbiae]|uniref:DDE Tnp4 domain-containing protein n=1 Tax=Macrosiphum euphorbiae TaxID=13131 RepID=A0AAV0WVT1_9HEMI|nr:unnamed protein product [Macrosiphum euphorbiae]